MDEYNMELKPEWLRDVKYTPYASTVSTLFQEVPKPGNAAQLVSTLPLFRLFPLHCKLPGIKGMKFTRGSFGTSSKTNEPQSLEFITYDPYCYEVNTNYYDSLYDKHLKNYFKSEAICKFLRKINILDDTNQPQCSLKDLNSYRFYLSRIHKDAVKREYNRLLEERLEKNLWQHAQLSTVKNYFKKLQRENSLILTREQREAVIKEKRNKRTCAIENIKNREKRLADRDEHLREQWIIKKDLIMRKRAKYDKVLARGKELAKVRPIKTIVKLRKKNAIKEEILKNKKMASKLKSNYDAEKKLFIKTLTQISTLNWLNELAAVKERSRQLKLEKKNKRERHEFQTQNDRMLCFKENLKSTTTVADGTAQATKNKEEVEESEGIGFIVNELRKIDRGGTQADEGVENLGSEKETLRKVARQMIRRSVYLNIKHLCQHFSNLMIACFFETLTIDINRTLPSFEEATKFIQKPSSNIDSSLDPAMACSPYTRYLGEPITTAHLRDHLIKKKNLLQTLHKNATILFELIRGRVLLLLCVGDPFEKMPQLRKKIMENRKKMTIKELQNSLLKILAISDRKKFFTSEVGQIASLFSYAFLLKTRKIIIHNDKNIKATSECSLKIADPTVWEMIKYVFKYMQEQYDMYDERNVNGDITETLSNGSEETVSDEI